MAWGRLELPAGTGAEHPGLNGSTLRICPTCRQSHPDWEPSLLASLGLANPSYPVGGATNEVSPEGPSALATARVEVGPGPTAEQLHTVVARATERPSRRRLRSRGRIPPVPQLAKPLLMYR